MEMILFLKTKKIGCYLSQENDIDCCVIVISFVLCFLYIKYKLSFIVD